MSRTRHRLLLPALVGGLLLGVTTPAQALMSGTAALPQMAVGTAAVVPPSQVTITSSKCTVVYDSSGGRSSQLQVQVSWRPSTSAGVTGYVVTAAFSDGSKRLVASVDASTTSSTVTYTSSSGPQTMQFTVTTTTRYGWTAESAPSRSITC